MPLVIASEQTAGMDFSAVNQAPATDMFLVKLSYWWGG
jgi:hypothetical protein